MAWSVIRKATPDDVVKLESRAKAFCQRHGIEVDEFSTAVQAVEAEIVTLREVVFDTDNATRINTLWRAAIRRALDSKAAEGIAYGHVGFEA